MSQTSEQKKRLKETLQRLRAERGPSVERVVEAHNARLSVRKKIRTELAKGPVTVPALATACGLAAREVLWHVAAMRKYGELVEDVQDGDYFTYRLVPRDGKGG